MVDKSLFLRKLTNSEGSRQNLYIIEIKLEKSISIEFLLREQQCRKKMQIICKNISKNCDF